MKEPRVTWRSQRDQVLDPADPTRDFLTDIRSNWLTTAPSQPEDGSSPARRSSRIPFQIDPVHAVKSILASLRRAVASLGRGLTGGLRAKASGTSMLAFLASVLVIGALGYVVVVDCVLDPATASNAAQSDTPPAAPEKESPIASFFGLSSQSADATNTAPAPGAAAPAPDPGHAMEIDDNAAAAIARSAETSVQKAAIATNPPILTDAAGTMAHTTHDSGTLGFQSSAQSSTIPNTASTVSGASAQRRPADSQERASSLAPARESESVPQRNAVPALYKDTTRAEAVQASAPTNFATPTAVGATAAASSSAAARAGKAAPAPAAVNPVTPVHATATVPAPAAVRVSTTAESPAMTEVRPASRQASGSSSAEQAEAAKQAAVARSVSDAGTGVYQLEYLGTGARSGQPVRIVITPTALQFMPETAGEPGAFRIPFASITSVQTGNTLSRAGASTLTIEYRDARNADKQVRFGDGAPATAPTQASSLQARSQLASLRSAILAAKARSAPIAVKAALR